MKNTTTNNYEIRVHYPAHGMIILTSTEKATEIKTAQAIFKNLVSVHPAAFITLFNKNDNSVVMCKMSN